MSFKDSYRKLNEKVIPEDTFIDSLRSEMNVFPDARRRSGIKLTVIRNVVAACLALAVMAAVRYAMPDENNRDITIPAQSVTQPSGESGMFSQSLWYDEGMSEAEIYACFICRIQSREDITDAYVKQLDGASDDVSFTEDDRISASQINAAADEIREASVAHESGSGSGLAYMAVFSNGDIIKFTVYDSGYIKVNEVASQYKK